MQATQTWMGETKLRWLIYFRDGSKAITWAPSETEARARAERDRGPVLEIRPSASGQRP